MAEGIEPIRRSVLYFLTRSAPVSIHRYFVSLRPSTSWHYQNRLMELELHLVSMWEQVVYFVDGMVGDLLKDAFQPSIRFNAVHLAGAE